MLNTHADTQAYYGRMVKARDLARQAADSAVRATPRKRRRNGLPFRPSAKWKWATRARRGRLSHVRWRSPPDATSEFSPRWR